jgi:hypothetical protein
MEQAIGGWRKRMQAKGLRTSELLDELESHLREEIEENVRAGLDEMSAFEFAAKQIGQAGDLKNEFMKIDDGTSAFDRKLMDVAFGLTATVFPLWILAMLLWFKTGAFSELTSGQQAAGILAVLLFGLLIWSGRLGYRFLPVIRSKRIRGFITTAFAVPVMVWWYVFIAIIAQRYDFTMGQFGVTFLWAFVTPAGLMMGLSWGMETAARRGVKMAT